MINLSKSHNSISTDVLIVGSGAGGATTAAELSAAGFDVLVLEEGNQHTLKDYGASATTALERLYRNRGMTPILGSVPIGFVEGCCLGGSTEVNNGFWYRLPEYTAMRWKADYGIQGLSTDDLEPHFEWLESSLSVSARDEPIPTSSDLFRRGAQIKGWKAQKVLRAASNCKDSNKCASGCPRGAKGLSRNLIPQAQQNGARIMPGYRVKKLLQKGNTITGVIAATSDQKGQTQLLDIKAKHIFICAGSTQTPLILRKSGITSHIGNSLTIHPMLKVAALFKEQLNAHQTVLPSVQIHEFKPDIVLSGSYFSTGHLALVLSNNWTETHPIMSQYKNMANYCVTVRGTGHGSVRPFLFEDKKFITRYELSDQDLLNLSKGLSYLCQALLAAGAIEIYPCVGGLTKITSEKEARMLLDETLPAKELGLTAVHAFSTCPMGERENYCAVDSFGKLHGFENLYVNDASILPDAPGVNPQGTIMAIARRNAHHFIHQNT